MKLIIGNWKMNPESPVLAKNLFAQTAKIKVPKGVKLGVAVPYIHLGDLPKADLLVGAQDVSAFDGVGAHTGQISVAMLKKSGVKFAIIGHSERRQELNEDDAVVAKKCMACAGRGVLPILCVGEPLAARQKGESEAVEFVRYQLEKVFSQRRYIPKELVVAYEPFWAISTARDKQKITPEVALRMMNEIRAWLEKRSGQKGWTIIYGGSVSPENAGNFINLGDGALVGAASLDPKKMLRIIKALK